eukprot:snap_masked-scaffold_47-processed-gene-1.53-mRNA-1 protein AED:1.00 eAED:1.00 QI:0/0/0/0/1/1/2/0/110
MVLTHEKEWIQEIRTFLYSTKTISSYYPDLHYLAYLKTSNKKFEELLSTDRNMTMRFAERTLYNKTDVEKLFLPAVIGQFQTANAQIKIFTSIDSLEVDFSFHTLFNFFW